MPDSLIRMKELVIDIADLRKEFLASCKRNKDLESMNERLRAKMDVMELQHNNCMAKLKDNGIR